MANFNIPAPRISGFDAARSLVMLLAMAAFSLVAAIVLVPDAATTLACFTWIIPPMILTVVPAFFIIAGYLGSSLLMRAKAKSFVISRTKRLLPILVISGAAGYFMHIWVHLLPLWYLVFCSLIALILSSISRKVSFAVRSRLSVYTNLLSFGPVAVGIYGILVAAVVGAFTGIKLGSFSEQNLTLAYDWRIGLYCYLAFSIGWLLQRSGSTALKKLANCTFIYLCLGGVLMSAAGSLPAFLVVPAAITAGIYFAFAIIGGCLALCSRQIRLFRYLADAGQWVYSVQPILAALLLAVVAPTPAFLGSVLVSFATYQFVIRKTVLGRILAGRRRV
jgi:hypothetical protein